MLYLYVLCILISETTAVTLLKKFSLTSSWHYFLLGVGCYVVVAFFLAMAFKHDDMAIVNVLRSAFSVLSVAGVGYLYFKEHISLIEIIGISLILAGVIILRLKLST